MLPRPKPGEVWKAAGGSFNCTIIEVVRPGRFEQDGDIVTYRAEFTNTTYWRPLKDFMEDYAPVYTWEAPRRATERRGRRLCLEVPNDPDT